MTARLLGLVDRLIGGRTTTRTASAEFGPSQAARYQRWLDRYSDLELLRKDKALVLAEIRATRRARAGVR